jgi:tetratricopeptide (TPR) repeat protein
MTDHITTQEPQPKKRNKISLATLASLLIILTVLIASYMRTQQEAKVAAQLSNAEQLFNERKLYEAVLILDEVIANHPNNVEAYRLRSMVYGNSRSNVFTEQQSYYQNSLRDIDKLIELEPTNGNNYVNRNLVLRTWAEMINDSATKFQMYELAKENTEKAVELGVSPDYSYVYRHHARNLIESNHCEEGLKETQALVDQTLAMDPVMTTYNIYLTEAYICLNQLDKALEVAQRIQCEDPVATCRSGFLAELYYQIGDYDQALEVLNTMINAQPLGGGWRYFIRAAIHYENGEKDLALQDLATGDSYTWEGNGVFWYVKAQMALEEGDVENGVSYLQKAESTLDVQYTPLRQNILKELESYGAQPLTLAPSIPFQVTPIP